MKRSNLISFSKNPVTTFSLSIKTNFNCFVFFLLIDLLSFVCHLLNLDFNNDSLFQKGGGAKLRYLDVSGCKSITDKTLAKLASSLEKMNSSVSDIEESECNDYHSHCVCRQNSKNVSTVRNKKGLEYLALSGCYQVTDDGLR